MRPRAVDYIILAIIPFAGSLLTVLAHFSYLESVFFFLGLPVLYLSVRASKICIVKTAIFAAIFSLPLSLIIDHIITADAGWYVPVSAFRIGIVPIEDLLFGFLSVWSFTLIYEYFIDRNESTLFWPEMRVLIKLVATALILFGILYILRPTLLDVPYAFLTLCAFFLLAPLIAISLRFPRLVKKYIPVGVYFFFVSLCWELAALYVGQWVYPGLHYVGWVQLFDFRLPIEEFVFFWFVYAPAILAWYEFFDDDRR